MERHSISTSTTYLALAIGGIFISSLASAQPAPPVLTDIYVDICTSNFPNAGTDGDVYFGIGGREFYLDTPGNDFERNYCFVRLLGHDGGAWGLLNFTSTNDPRNPLISLDDVSKFPVYIRFRGTNRNDGWTIEGARIQVYKSDGTSLFFFTPLSNVRLSTKSGELLYLSPCAAHGQPGPECPALRQNPYR